MAITLKGWMKFLGGTVFNPDKGAQLAGPDRISTTSGVNVTDDTAMTIGAVFRCIRVISEVCALLPIKAYRRLPDGDREELEYDHWLPKLIRQPNEEMSGDQWAEAMYAQEAGWGNAYTQIVPNSLGIPIELWPYKVDRMVVTRNADLTVAYKYPDPQGVPRDLPRGRVGHMRGFTVDGIMGLSPLGLARNAAGLAVQAERYAGSFFAAGGQPAGVLTSERILNEKQRQQIRDEYGPMGDASTGKRMWLLEASLKYEAITVNPEDMQLLLTRAFQVAEIARFFGVPLFLLFETEKSTSWGSGIEQQNNALKTYTLAPYAQDMANLWNSKIIPVKERKEVFVDVDLDALQTADFAAMLAYYGGLADKGITTRNEIRKRLRLPRNTAEAADQLTVQAQMVPLEMIGKVQPSHGSTTPGGAAPAEPAAPVAQPGAEAA